MVRARGTAVRGTTRMRGRLRSVRRAALTSVGGTVAVIVFMDWVPTALNRNILLAPPSQRLVGTLIHATAGCFVFVAHLTGRRWLIFTGAVWYSVVLTSAILNGWVPYVFATYPGEISVETFVQEYGRNVRFLPPIQKHTVVPDVQHVLIHLGVLLSCVLSWAAFRRAR